MSTILIFKVIFIASLGVSIIASLLSILETVGIWRFWPFAYRYGLIVFDLPASIFIPERLMNQTLDLPNVKAKFVSSNEFYFRQPFAFSGSKFRGPFSIKGSFTHQYSEPKFVCRISFFVIMYLIAFFMCWTAGGIVMLIEKTDIKSIGLMLFGWITVGVMIRYIALESRRLKKEIESITAYLANEHA